MDRPERAEFFRVFPRHILMDEEYEFLTREEWGSVFLLMMGQWIRNGSLPSDNDKLAIIAKCTTDQLESLLSKWPKLLPIEGQPGRVGIPYLTKEWSVVMEFYSDQTVRSVKGVAARRKANRELGGGSPMGIPMDQPMDEPMGIPNQDQDQDQDSSSSAEEVLPLEKQPSREAEKEIPVEEVKKIARLINASLRKVGGTPVKTLGPPQADLIASYLQDPGWVIELRKALKYVEGNPWFKENPGKFTFDLMLRPGKVIDYAARLSPATAPSTGGPNTPRSGGSAALTPLTEAEVKSILGDHYGTYTELLDIFPSGKILPTRDIPTILQVLKETSASSLIQAAKIHRAHALDGEKGSTRYMKPFDKWVELGLHLLANDSRAERVPRPALKQDITGGHDLAAMAMSRATQDLVTKLGGGRSSGAQDE
jgi:hypothetical protein